MNKNIKILISCHKKSKVPNSKIMIPIEVGTALRNNHIEGTLKDNDGDNISEKNKSFCELTAQYWAWKNLDADYYGFFHYRRYMNFSEKKYPVDPWLNVIEDTITANSLKKYDITDEKIQSIVEGYDLVITDEKDIAQMPHQGKSVYEQYANGNSLNIKDLELVGKILKEKYSDYASDFDELLKGSKTCLCNMYIMKKELFQKYMEWLFDILFEFEKQADMSDYTVEGYRTPGHLAERLMTVFCHHIERTQNLKIKRVQTVVFLNTDQKMTLEEAQKIKPAFEKDNIAIAVAANDYFIPYCATFLKSVAENANQKRNYDILLLSQDVSAINVKRMTKMFDEYTNISLRVIDPGALIDGYDFFTRGHFSKETYYRLVLPELLPNYDKMLYLDSDMIAQDDVAKLYDENVEGYLLAACNDADTAGLYNGWQEDKKEYTDNVLKLKEPYQYFQAGVLLLNLKEFRKRYKTKEILEFAVSEKWQLLDQDILNKLCEGSVKYVDMSWNVMVDYAGIRIREIIAKAPRWLNEKYMESRKAPKIIHYAGPQKPWFEPEMDMGTIFWEYAKNTPYYEIAFARLSQRMCEVHRVGSNNNGENKGMFRRVAGCIYDHGLVYTVRYAIRCIFNK